MSWRLRVRGSHTWNANHVLQVRHGKSKQGGHITAFCWHVNLIGPLTRSSASRHRLVLGRLRARLANCPFPDLSTQDLSPFFLIAISPIILHEGLHLSLLGADT